jgi:hypothetical protein
MIERNDSTLPGIRRPGGCTFTSADPITLVDHLLDECLDHTAAPAWVPTDFWAAAGRAFRWGWPWNAASSSTK